MPTESSSATSRARLAIATGLPRPQLLAVLWTAFVVSAVELGFKLLRIAHQHELTELPLWRRAALLTSECCYLAGFLCTALAVALIGERVRRPRLALALIQLAALWSLLVACVAHGYFASTGGTLDYPLVAFAWSRPRDTGPIVLGEIHRLVGSVLVLAPLLIVAPGQWLLRKPHHVAPGPLTRVIAFAVCAVALFWCASEVDPPGTTAGFTREPNVTLATGFWSAQRARQPRAATDSHVPARKSGATSLQRLTQGTPPNVVFIVLESARADATSVYTPGLDTTPALARLAQESTVVERAYTVVPHTSKSLVAMLCGFEPRTSAELVETQPLGLPGRCLPRLLRELGYDAAFFQAGNKRFESYTQLAQNLGFDALSGGEDYATHGFEKVNYFGYEDAIMLEPSRVWLTEHAREPFIAVYLTNASHHPYQTPKRWPKRRFVQQRSKNDYLNALGYVDSVMGKLIDQYKAAGLYERTLFVVLGDHGEGFDEHGMSTHDNILYEEGVRIPLLLRAPAGQQRPARVAGPVNQLALVPTVLDVLGLAPLPAAAYEARSIYAATDQQPLQLACFRNAHCLATLRNDHKLIYFYQDRPPQLFDLQTDPQERHNLAAEQPERVSSWVHALLDWETAVDKLHEKSGQRALSKYVQREPFAQMQHARVVQFGPFVELVGFNAESPRPDGAHFTCFLHVKQPLPVGYHFVLHLRSGFWHARSLDEQPVRGLYPYRRWQPGDYIANFYRTDWPASWRVMEACLEMLDADDKPVPGRAIDGAQSDCVPLTVLDHETQRER